MFQSRSVFHLDISEGSKANYVDYCMRSSPKSHHKSSLSNVSCCRFIYVEVRGLAVRHTSGHHFLLRFCLSDYICSCLYFLFYFVNVCCVVCQVSPASHRLLLSDQFSCVFPRVTARVSILNRFNKLSLTVDEPLPAILLCGSNPCMCFTCSGAH